MLGADDTRRAHIEDTLRVGDGLCTREAVEICVRQGPEHILYLANQIGVAFDRDKNGDFKLGREGGHTARRIVHVTRHDRRGHPERPAGTVRALRATASPCCPTTWPSIC